jgi:hypothetical protein
MGIGDVIEQKEGSLASVANSATEATSTDTGGANGATGPNIRLMANGTEYRFSTQTLILYGVAVADLLLLYIALRV